MIVMDSGLGGISVVRALRAARPGLALTYIADTAGFPYGGRDAEDLARRAETILRAADAGTNTAVVVACNTLSTLCLARLRAGFANPFVGTVPAVKVAAGVSRRFTLLATPNTADSAYSLDLIARFAPDAVVDRVGAPRLAGMAERMLLGLPVDRDALAAEIAPCFQDDALGRTDAIVLGCTHYPLIAESLRAVAPWPVRWIDSGAAIARRALDLMDGASGPSTAFVTGEADVEPYRAVFRREGFDTVAVLPTLLPADAG